MRRRRLNRLHGKGNTKRLLYAGSRRQIQLRRRYLVGMKKEWAGQLYRHRHARRVKGRGGGHARRQGLVAASTNMGMVPRATLAMRQGAACRKGAEAGR